MIAEEIVCQICDVQSVDIQDINIALRFASAFEGDPIPVGTPGKREDLIHFRNGEPLCLTRYHVDDSDYVGRTALHGDGYMGAFWIPADSRSEYPQALELR